MEDFETPYQSYNKKSSEKRHRYVHNLLTREFHDCTVTYDGQQGHDHCIQLRDFRLFIETKTCEPIIKTGEHYTPKNRPMIFDMPRLGRLKFDKRRNKLPYRVSQHDDLVQSGGWYIFVISNKGRRTVSGMRASDLRLTGAPNIQRLVWSSVLSQCYPDWLQRLKSDFYSRATEQKNPLEKGASED